MQRSSFHFAVDGAFDDGGLGGVVGLVVVEPLVEPRLELGGVLVGEDDVPGGQAVLEGVPGGVLLPSLGLRAGALLGVALVGLGAVLGGGHGAAASWVEGTGVTRRANGALR